MSNVLNYSGMNNEKINANLLSLIQELSKNSVPNKTLVKQTILSSIELLDNALRHGCNHEISINLELLDSGVRIIVSNYALLPDIIRLKATVEQLLGMNKVELEALYFKKLKEGLMNERGGAGLGLIQVIRNGVTAFDVQSTKQQDEIYRCQCLVNFEKIS
jgi:hypothetical protein